MTAAVESSTRKGRVLDALRRRTEWRATLLLIIVVTGFGITQPSILTSYGVTLEQIALYGLVALGLTLVILQGELDLSVGSVLALAGTVMASQQNVLIGVILGLCVGILAGLVNAALVVFAGVNSFIATLGTLFALGGLAFVVSGGTPVPVKDINTAIAFGSPAIGPITPRVIIFFVIFALLQIFLTRTRIGREFYAVGGNRQAAVDAGIPVRRRLFTSFIICGLLASLAGIVDALELTSANPTAGSDVLLSGIAAAVLGGILLNGGRGSLVGTLIGAAALGTLQVGLNFAGVTSEVQEITIGAVLVLAVTTDIDTLRLIRNRIRSATAGRQP